MDIAVAAVLFVAGIIIVLKGADILISSSVSIALRLNMPEMLVGLTIVALGTSAPELIVNVLSSIKGESDIVLGNVIGSNISNILLILGISSMISPIIVQRITVWREIPLAIIAVLAMVFMGNDLLSVSGSKVFTRLDGAVLLVVFVGFLMLVFRNAEADSVEPLTGKRYGMPVSLLLLFLGFAGLFVGGKLVVDQAVIIATYFNVSQKLIALTIVSVGTSLPELATSAVASYKKRPGIAVGNIIGSNVFNTFFVLGISALVHPVQYDSLFNIDMAVLAGASVVLWLAMFTGRRMVLERWEGTFFLLSYAAYIAYLIYRK